MFEIASDKLVYALSQNHAPVARVTNGETVVFHTCDCFQNQITHEEQEFGTLDWERINPATGPLFIEGADPGDTLAVEILSIDVAEQGVMTTGPNLGVLGDELAENVIRMVPIRDGVAHFSSSLRIPLSPMIGVIGTAPAGADVSCGTPGDHGGNMDCTKIRAGATLLLPVNVPGALLAMGDLHAAMADGEVAVCGIEIAGKVTVRLHVIKGKTWKLPMLIDAEHVIAIASEERLDEAAERATKNMVDFLEGSCGMERAEAVLLLSAAGSLRICQVVDPKKTARMELPRVYAEQLGFSFANA
ncbi:acetamidase/formamidase family protein [Ferroacidibacillus organovorans]|uniref:Acetamidase n=1 Tax=Ferroacidibacillus organovorans TaxID=1765683 RepID=A0A162TUS2_9BACL|nr:acetamidase/formamidase family protein [Ferroacidibacillus organovorans]KYP81153.1 acetamidase [Ferroacidibacillus organovorans]OAG93818.1 acetamidase [Ferroacidibacillus organovorans]OPG15291.1 acetamidase [Ferroacidibacillus organovorans]